MPPINDSKINHHVADSYIALFSHFIPCGVWEAIYILEGLLKNTSDIQPTPCMRIPRDSRRRFSACRIYSGSG